MNAVVFFFWSSMINRHGAEVLSEKQAGLTQGLRHF